MILQRTFGRNLMLAVLALGVGAAAMHAAAPLQDSKPQKGMQKSAEHPQDEKPTTDANLPDADAILDRYIEALGGAEAIRKHSYRTSKGDFGLPDFGIAGTFEVKQAAPHFFILTVSIPTIGDVKHGYNGEVGWSKDENTGPLLLEDEMFEEMKREGDFYSDLNYKKHFSTRETISKQEHHSTVCYKVHLASPGGADYEAFYSVDTGLLIGMNGESTTPQGKISTESTMEDYKVVDGLKIAHRMTVRYPELRMTQVMTVKEVSHEEFEKSAFDLPKEIQTLIEIKKEEANKDKGEGDDNGEGNVDEEKED